MRGAESAMSETGATAGAAEAERTRATWAGIAAVYLSGLLQGLTLVSFPASSGVLKAQHGFSDAQYGLIFLPQVAFAVVGSLSGGALAARLGLRWLLAASLLANALSQLALGTSTTLSPAPAFAAVLLGTSCLGLGFGLSAAPLNGYPPAFFPRRPDAAIVALHTALGLGLAVGPLLAGRLVEAGRFGLFPWLLLSLAALLVAAAASVRLPTSAAPAAAAPVAGGARPLRSPVFWLFATVAVLYAFGEGTFSNWVLIYLGEERGLPPATAALSLSAFWGAMAGGRLLISLVLLRVPAERVWTLLPVMMAAAFLLLPAVHGALLGVVLFAFAGLACSAFFPLTIGLAARRFPGHTAWTASALMAALMVGVGLGSFLVGPLRGVMPLARLYSLSAAYPLVALVLVRVILRGR